MSKEKTTSNGRKRKQETGSAPDDEHETGPPRVNELKLRDPDYTTAGEPVEPRTRGPSYSRC